MHSYALMMTPLSIIFFECYLCSLWEDWIKILAPFKKTPPSDEEREKAIKELIERTRKDIDGILQDALSWGN